MAYDFIEKPQAVSSTRNTLSVDGALYQRLLAKLDENSAKGKPSAKRVFRRLGYAHPRMQIHIESEGHNSRSLIVATRNLSQGGVSILHSSFMYNNTYLTVDLIDNSGEIISKQGVVTRCEHRGGRVHEVGIKFDTEIRLRDYLIENPENLLFARERIDPESMNIKLLVFTELTEFSAIMRQFLLPSSLCYTFAKTEEEALEKFMDQDMLFFHIDPDSMKTPELIRMMRDKGFKNPIILAGNPKSEIDQHVINACGADMILPWPSDEQTVLCSIAEYIFNEWTPESLENIRSCISPEMRLTLKAEMARLGVTMDQQIRTKNQEEVHNSCIRIRMMAPLLGLNSMRSAIDDLTDRVAVDGSLEELAPELTEISMICKALNRAAA